MQSELIIKSNPIDFELCELLGEKPSDFLVLCFDGVQLEFFGTPYDSPMNRIEKQWLVDHLNDTSEKSIWPKMWENWKAQICKQFGLAAETTDKYYRPVASYKISRVCAGYSQHLHAAIGLFETCSDKITDWNIRKFASGINQAQIIAKDGKIFSNQGDKMPLVIVETIRELLKANHTNQKK